MRGVGAAAAAVAMLIAPAVSVSAASGTPRQATQGQTNSSSWTIQPTANVLAPDDSLAAASCSTAGACTAVGSQRSKTGAQLTLAEAWNGTSWSVKKTPNPKGATSSGLTGVSCTAANACTAVGNSGGFTLAEAWNGTAWSIQITPIPSGATSSSLSGVSCTAANACTAVGSYEDSSFNVVTLAEAWNGSAWSIQTTPNPSGATYSSLSGVSCTAASACTAVGSYEDSSFNVFALAEAWNGTTWSIQTTPGLSGYELSGVSCTAASACTAVGSHNGSSTLAETWNGTAWSVQSTPTPSGANSTGLLGVSCVASACTAVGYYFDSSNTEFTLAEAWNGSTWSIQMTPGLKGSPGLSGVSCTAASACTAVGSYQDSSFNELTLAEAWNSTTWSIQKTPSPKGADTNMLSSISCTSASACTAVGSYRSQAGTSSTSSALAEAWNGTKWSVQKTPNLKRATSSSLSGVSCTAASACTAVGYYEDSSFNVFTLAEGWNGTTWSVQTTPTPAGAVGSQLSAVSCTAASACTAVGVYSDSSDTLFTLAEAWNGTAWSIQTTPNPSGATGSELSAVSCTAASACSAVGISGALTLAEAWNGTAWSIQTTPNPSGATYSSLSGVSCTAASACTAVGFYDNSSGTFTLAEAWNGTAWSIQTTPHPSGATGSQLSAVSCTASSACTTVGVYFGGSGTFTLAEAWNGTAWSIQTTPNPSGAAYSSLAGVSCTAASACTAVGYYFNSSGTEVTLGEAEP